MFVHNSRLFRSRSRFLYQGYLLFRYDFVVLWFVFIVGDLEGKFSIPKWKSAIFSSNSLDLRAKKKRGKMWNFFYFLPKRCSGSIFAYMNSVFNSLDFRLQGLRTNGVISTTDQAINGCRPRTI